MMLYSSMKPGLWPAKIHSIPRTNATMAQAIGNSAVALMLLVYIMILLCLKILHVAEGVCQKLFQQKKNESQVGLW